MESLGKYLKVQREINSSVTERGELLRYFAEEINRERWGTQYPEVTMPRVAFMVRKLTPWKSRLYALKSEMEEVKRLPRKLESGEWVTPSMVFFSAIKRAE